MFDVRIEPKEEGKGRVFHATCLGTVEADALWEGGTSNTDDNRPVWAMFAGSEQGLRPFMANLTLGRKVLSGDASSHGRGRNKDRMEFLKSAGYQTFFQREPEGVIATVFLSDLFRMDPGMVDPDVARFVLLIPSDWSEKQTIDPKPIVRHIRRLKAYEEIEEEEIRALVPLSFLFCSFLDRRTTAPLVSDGRFYMQLFLSCLEQGLASWASQRDQPYGRESRFGFHSAFRFEARIEGTGITRALAFQASHESIDRVMAEEVQTFFSKVK